MKYDYGYCYWQTLVNELEKVKFTKSDYENVKQIKFYQCLFQLMSTKWFEKNYEVKDFADIWCIDVEKSKTYEEYFNEFKSYLWYATDRMNLNRWLYSQTCINRAFDLAYYKLTKEESDKYFEECGWDNNYKNKMTIEAENWFDTEFEKTYKKVEEE